MTRGEKVRTGRRAKGRRGRRGERKAIATRAAVMLRSEAPPLLLLLD
jgi:hypothetical protein